MSIVSAVLEVKNKYFKNTIRVVLTAFILLVLLPYSAFSEVDPSEVPVFSFPNQVSPIGQVGAQVVQGASLIGAAEFRQVCGVTGAGYSVAVIDTGVDYNHPSLGGGWGNRVVAGYDFVNNDNDPMDDNGHGTHVAGIIASNDPTHTGIAPGANIVALKVLGANGSGNFTAVESALQWVIANRATYNIVAVNLSLGTGNFTSNPYDFLEDELAVLLAANVQVWAASGNSFFGYGSVPGIGYPAISPQMIAIGAVYDANVGQRSYQSGAIDYTTAADRITSFTQRHSLLDFMAPGAIITSTQVGGGFVGLSGTSMAAPIAAAAGTLVRAALDALNNPNIHQNDIVDILAARAVVVNDGDDENDNVTNTGLNFLRIELDGVCEDISGPPAPSASPSQTPSPSPSSAPPDFVQPSASASPSASSMPSSSALPSASPISSSSPSPSASAEPTPQTVIGIVKDINIEIRQAFKARTPDDLQAAITKINSLIESLIKLLNMNRTSAYLRSETLGQKEKITNRLIKVLQRFKKLVARERTVETRARIKKVRRTIRRSMRRLVNLE